MLLKPHGLFRAYAQEKPELGEQPPPGRGGRVGDPMRMLEADICLTTSLLLHLGHSMVSFCPEDVVMVSNWFLQSRHSYSKIGMDLILTGTIWI